MSDQPVQTPILELARGVPKNVLAQWETQWFEDGTPCGHATAPVGVYLHKLADEIERQARYIKSLEHCEAVHKERIAELEAAIKAQIAANPKGSYPCLHYAIGQDVGAANARQNEFMFKHQDEPNVDYDDK